MLKRSFEWALPAVLLGVALTGWFSARQLTAAPAQAPAAKTVWDGVYSEDQAKRGGSAYVAVCAACHRTDLSGQGGVLIGTHFMERWREDSLDSLYNNIKTTMPRNDPGSLKADMYLDIVSYILQQNSFPSGADELKADTLKNIQVVGKGGAEPLPLGVLSQAFGCVNEGPNNTWLLNKATALVRTRNPDSSSDAELKAAGAAPAGTLTYSIVDSAFYHPERHKDHKVEVKGFTAPNNGLTLTSLTMISETCP